MLIHLCILMYWVFFIYLYIFNIVTTWKVSTKVRIKKWKKKGKTLTEKNEEISGRKAYMHKHKEA